MKKLGFSRFLIRRAVPIMAVAAVLCAVISSFCSYAVNNDVQREADNIFDNFALELISIEEYYQDSTETICYCTDMFDDTEHSVSAEDFHMVFAVTDAVSNEIISVTVSDSPEKKYLMSVLKDDLLLYGVSEESIDDFFQNTVPVNGSNNRILSGSPYFSMDGREYFFNYVCSFDFSKTSGYAVQIIWAVGLFIGIAVSVILSVIAHNKYCAQYEIDEYRRNMTSALAHDLKTPLTAIMGYSENLKNNVHSEKRDYYADAVIENVRYMNEIITGTLELAKIEEQNITLNKTDVDMVSLADELLEKYKADFDDRGISVSVSGRCVVNADRGLISRALENLITNAVKYTSDGGSLEITAAEQEFRISNTCSAELKGNTEDFCRPFGKKDAVSGSGIGLAIVKSIVNIHKFGFEACASGGKFTVKIKLK
ncbi:MAG: HAMP domain-containing histidine kinase [Oscillospiraceae bacterium]|nr:HAMP domain-containing histidine kinase [Oscillospiraceae bacterium]